MEKYAVVIDEEKTKEASDKSNTNKFGSCPECGESLAQPAYCRRCGTEPFEKKP